MQNIEKNTIKSFKLVKDDVNSLKSEVSKLRIEIASLKLEVISLRSSSKVRVKELPSLPVKLAKKSYVSSQTSKRFHIDDCPFASQIKSSNIVRFDSKSKALNEGLKPCRCSA